MKKLLFALLLASIPVEAFAISRYQSTALPCGEIRQRIADEGAVILRWQSERIAGLPRFDRYIQNRSFCRDQEYAKLVYVPAADTRQCPVKRCEELLSIDDFIRR